MSEFTATIDAYFEDIEQQENLLNLLKANKHIEIENEKFSIQDYSVAETINFTLWAGGHDQTKLVTKWLSSFSPKLSIIESFSDESEKRLGFEDGTKKAIKSVIQGFSRVSNRYEAGLVFQGGMRKAIAYLKDNDVDLRETFQGERHIDRIFDKYDPDHDTKIFELLIEQEKITTDLKLFDSYSGTDGPLAIECMNTDLAIRTLINGGDPNIVLGNGNNLLSDYYYCPDSDGLKELTTLLELGVKVNHKNHSGKQPIDNFFIRLRKLSPVSYSEELCLLEQLKSLIKYGAEPYFTDEYGFGCLFYAKGCEHITRYLEDNFEGLRVVDDPDNYNQLLLNRLNIKKDRDNGLKKLPIYVHEGLHTELSLTEFCELFLNPAFLNSEEKMLGRIVEYLDAVLDLDSRELLDLLCAAGVPSEGVFTYSSYYGSSHLGVTKIEDTVNIKKHLEDRNFFEKLSSSFEFKKQWCEDNISELDDVHKLANYCSDKWQERQYESYTQQGKTVSFGSYLGRHMKARIQSASRSWGAHIWIGSNNAVLETSNNNYKIITIEEAYELPEFEVLSNFLSNRSSASI